MWRGTGFQLGVLHDGGLGLYLKWTSSHVRAPCGFAAWIGAERPTVAVTTAESPLAEHRSCRAFDASGMCSASGTGSPWASVAGADCRSSEW